MRKKLENKRFKTRVKALKNFLTMFEEDEPIYLEITNSNKLKEEGLRKNINILMLTNKDKKCMMLLSRSTNKNLSTKEEITCCVCDGPCEMNTEYEGSAICMDKNCSVHNEE